MSLENGGDNVIQNSNLSEADLEAKLASDFASEFDGEESEEDKPAPVKSRKAVQADAEDAEDPDNLELSEEDAEDGEDESEAEDETEDEEDEKPTLVKLKGGEEVTLDELENGYLREKDYRQKTQEVASIRKEVTAAKETVAAAEREAKEALDLVTSVMQALMPQAPSLDILRTDPQDYMLKKAEYEAQVTLLNDLVGKAREVGKGTAAAQQVEYNNFIREEREKLAQKIPEFKSAKAYNQWIEKAADESAEIWGADPEIIKRIQDSVTVTILRDALAYRKALKAAKGKAPQQGQVRHDQSRSAQPTERKQTRILKPGTAQSAPSNGADVSKKQFHAALNRSQSGDDSALASLIGKLAS